MGVFRGLALALPLLGVNFFVLIFSVKIIVCRILNTSENVHLKYTLLGTHLCRFLNTPLNKSIFIEVYPISSRSIKLIPFFSGRSKSENASELFIGRDDLGQLGLIQCSLLETTMTVNQRHRHWTP